MIPTKGLRFVGRRADGVVAVDVGDRHVVLVNTVEGLKTHPFDSLILNRFGEWQELDAGVTVSGAARARIERIVNANGRIVKAEQIGPLDVDPKIVSLMDDTEYPPTREDLIEMLVKADVDAAEELPPVISLQAEPEFMTHCAETLVPQLQAAGVEMTDPATFCAFMYAQRTGLMPAAMPDGMDIPEPAKPLKVGSAKPRVGKPYRAVRTPATPSIGKPMSR